MGGSPGAIGAGPVSLSPAGPPGSGRQAGFLPPGRHTPGSRGWRCAFRSCACDQSAGVCLPVVAPEAGVPEGAPGALDSQARRVLGSLRAVGPASPWARRPAGRTGAARGQFPARAPEQSSGPCSGAWRLLSPRTPQLSGPPASRTASTASHPAAQSRDNRFVGVQMPP